MACGNACREACTTGGEATLLSLEMFIAGAFIVVRVGAAPEAPPGRGVTDRPGSRERRRGTGWLAREPGRHDHVRVEHSRWGWTGFTTDPGPVSACEASGAPRRRHERAGTHGTGRRNSKPKGSVIGNRSAPIVPAKVGCRGLWDPLEESGASHGQSRGRETREDTELRYRVTATSPDSRTGLANLPCEEPDALVRACPDLWGTGRRKAPVCPAPFGTPWHAVAALAYDEKNFAVRHRRHRVLA